MQQELQGAAAQDSFSGRKQRAMNVGAQLVFPLLFSLQHSPWHDAAHIQKRIFLFAKMHPETSSYLHPKLSFHHDSKSNQSYNKD